MSSPLNRLVAMSTLVFFVGGVLAPTSSYAWRVKVGPIKACHNCSKGPTINPTKPFEKVAKTAAAAVVDVAHFSGSLVEVGAHVAIADTDGAKRALKRLNHNLRDVTVDLKASVKANFEAALFMLESPLLAGGFDFGAKVDLDHHISIISKRGIHKIGKALKVATKPENIGRIALLYGASTVGGPMGAAFANVMYDKYVLHRSMTDKDALKSFVIGAAAGYAGEAAANGFNVNSQEYSQYLAKVSSTVARNLTKSTGDILLNSEHLEFKALMTDIAAGIATPSFGTGFAQVVAEATAGGVTDSAIHQIVDGHKVDFDRVADSAINGFANGITQESVQTLVKVTLIDAIPAEYQRLDLQAFKKVSQLMTEMFSEIDQTENTLNKQFVLNKIASFSDSEQDQIAQEIKAGIIEVRNHLAKKFYNKNFDQLTLEEIGDSKFVEEYHKYASAFIRAQADRSPSLQKLVLRNPNELHREPAGVIDALVSLFGFGESVITAGKISDIRTDLLAQQNGSLTTGKDAARQQRIYEALNKLERLGILYLKGVTAKESVDLLSKYYTAVLGASYEIDNFPRGDQEAILKMFKKDVKKFYEKYEDMSTSSEYFLNLAQSISDDALDPKK